MKPVISSSVGANPTPLLNRISDYPRYHAQVAPDAEALVFGDARITYAALADAIDALAKALLAAGVEKGDRVATLQTPHPSFIVAFLASASIGAIWVGLNPRYREPELLYVLGDAQPKVLLARSRIGERSYDDELRAIMAVEHRPERLVVFDGDAVVAPAQSWPDFLAGGEAVPDSALEAARAACGGRDPCLIVYTSGSTGKPKGALLHHEGIAAFASEQNRIWLVSPLRTLNFLPINHVGSVVDLSMPAIIAGGTLVFMEQFSPARSLELMRDEGITFWASVPSVFALQLHAGGDIAAAAHAVQLIVWEGANMPAPLLEELLRLDRPMATNYGLTEAGSAATVLAPTTSAPLLTDTIGEAFPGVEIRLVGPDGEKVTIGEPGEIQLRSRYNMLGYWNRPDATREAFTEDGFLRTGDLAIRVTGEKYRIVGRLKEMFKSGGLNVYPREVEGVLETHPSISQAVVVSRPDPLWQEIGIAFVLMDDAVSEEALVDWCRQRLANYKIPKRIVCCDALPLLPIGKVDRAALKDRAGVVGLPT